MYAMPNTDPFVALRRSFVMEIGWNHRLLLVVLLLGLIAGCHVSQAPTAPENAHPQLPGTAGELSAPTTGPARASVTVTVYESYQ